MIKNFIIIYSRLLITMVLSLVTSSYVFRALGTEDYGLYSVVGGVVVILAFLNSAMVATTQRFLSFNLSEKQRLIEIFRISKTIHLYIGIGVFLLGETIGLYFVNNSLNFDESRRLAVNIVFQCSILSTLIMTINIPHLSMILVNKKVSFYALVGVVDAVLKLLLGLSLEHFFTDKLIFYAISNLFITSIMYGAFYWYSISHFQYIKSLKIIKSFIKMKEMLIFSAWNLIGVFAGLGQSVGVNILLNIYFSPQINSSRALSEQVYGAFNNINASAQTIYAPILINKFADSDDDLNSYIYLFSKLNFFVILMALVPTYYYLYELIELWLKSVPMHLISYLKILIIDLLIISFTGPLHTMIQATGDIKYYQIIVSGILLLNIPLGILFFQNHLPSETVFYSSLVLNALALIVRLVFLKYKNILPLNDYLLKVGLPSIFAVSIALIIYYFITPIYLKVILTEVVITLFLIHTFISNKNSIDLIKSIKEKMA